MTPRGMRLERTRRSSFGPSRQLDIGRWVLGLAILAVVVWLGTAFWRATRIEADLAGLDSGAVLTPAAARDLDLELVMPSSGERFRATVRDRKSVVWGKSVSVRVDLGGRRIIKKKKKHRKTQKHI